jgi:hypothetical protein
MNFRDVTQAVEVSYQGDQAFLVEALDKAVAEATKGAHRLGAKSKIKLEVIFAASDGRVSITAVIDVKTPKPVGVPAFAYADREGRLVSDDPRQEALPFPQPANEEKEK